MSLCRIRSNIFETNSSMCHSLVLFDKNLYKKWKNDRLTYIREYDDDPKKLYTYKEVVDWVKSLCEENGYTYNEDDLKEILSEEGFYTYDDFIEKYDIEDMNLDCIGQNYVIVSGVYEDR